MLRRQFIPFVVTLLAAFLCGGSASRLHLLAVLFAKPIVTLAFTALLLFVVQRSANVCRSLLFSSSSWVVWDFASALRRPPRRHLLRHIDLQLGIPEPPRLRTLFQRPPPALAR
ncbi:MAG TPA: hypothetical protein VE218_14865 [Acidobacteriaceae bacterium]|nr:hypothetical protein [Acidobacteriaceae bacterium]